MEAGVEVGMEVHAGDHPPQTARSGAWCSWHGLFFCYLKVSM